MSVSRKDIHFYEVVFPSEKVLTMLLHMAVQDYLYALGGKSPHTKRSTKTILGQFTVWCDAQDITLEQLTPTPFKDKKFQSTLGITPMGRNWEKIAMLLIEHPTMTAAELARRVSCSWTVADKHRKRILALINQPSQIEVGTDGKIIR